MSTATPAPLVRFLPTHRDVVSAQTVLPGVEAGQVWDLVSRPRRHAELDGGGNVRGLIDGPEAPEVGQSTVQRMRLYGILYRMRATVIRREPERAFAWVMPGGHTWAWEILPAGDPEGDSAEAITVRCTFDAAAARVLGLPLAPLYRLDGGFAHNRRSIALSLARLHRTFPPRG